MRKSTKQAGCSRPGRVANDEYPFAPALELAQWFSLLTAIPHSPLTNLWILPLIAAGPPLVGRLIRIIRRLRRRRRLN